MIGLTATIDAFEVVILLFFVGATCLAVFNVSDAWQNELAAIHSRDELVGLVGLEDLARAVLKLLFMAVPGVLLALSMMTTTSAVQSPEGTPQELVAAIVLRVVLILSAASLFAVTATSAWLRRRLADGRRTALEAAEALAARPVPDPPLGPGDANHDPSGLGPVTAAELALTRGDS